jgi:MbtH protein
MNSDDKDGTTYEVVMNHEEQYSIWPVGRLNPDGWYDAGKSGSKSECLAYIREVWSDMRPLSLRDEMCKQGTMVKSSSVNLNGNRAKATDVVRSS